MMAQSRAENTSEINNYGKYINQFPPNTIKSIRQYERINKKICRQKMPIIFSEICINEEMLPKYTHAHTHTDTHTHTHTHIYIYIYIGLGKMIWHTWFKSVRFFFFGDTSSQRYTVIALNLLKNLKMQFVKKLLPFHMKWPAEL